MGWWLNLKVWLGMKTAQTEAFQRGNIWTSKSQVPRLFNRIEVWFNGCSALFEMKSLLIPSSNLFQNKTQSPLNKCRLPHFLLEGLLCFGIKRTSYHFKTISDATISSNISHFNINFKHTLYLSSQYKFRMQIFPGKSAINLNQACSPLPPFISAVQVYQNEWLCYKDYGA